MSPAKQLLPAFCAPSGGIFLLTEPATHSTNIRHPAGTVNIREGSVHLIVALDAAEDQGTLVEATWKAAQEALDALAAYARIALSTAAGDQFYMTWRKETEGVHLTIVETAFFPWTTRQPPTIVELAASHPALRFYRLAQASHDLFDAFRNAYLCLESIVSSVSQKNRGESEQNWLRRVLTQTRLAAGVPPGIDIGNLVRRIYVNGRLPLFHAKSYDVFHVPLGPEREDISRLLREITTLVVHLLRELLKTPELASWVELSQQVQDHQTRHTFELDGVVLRSAGRESKHTPKIEIVDSPRRFDQLWARIFVPPPFKIDAMDEMWLMAGTDDIMAITLQGCVPLAGVASLTLEVNAPTFHASAPSLMHPR